MKNVVFVLSGFQNPVRSDLRNKATTMGAIYNDDWDETCTHLMYDFENKIQLDFLLF
jgi:DNA-repair protein XRCC1